MDWTAISKYNLKRKSLVTLVTNLSSGIGVDYDYSSKKLFYTDVATHLVYSSQLNEEKIHISQVK